MNNVINSYGIVNLLKPEEDVWYVLRYDTDYGMIIMTYYDQALSISEQRPIRKIVKRTYEGSSVREAFSTVLDNYQAKKDDETSRVPYQPTKVFDKPEGKNWDLTDIANNIKHMPRDFREFIFEVKDQDSKIIINSFIRKIDINRENLNTTVMDAYLASLKDFTKGDELSGW